MLRRYFSSLPQELNVKDESGLHIDISTPSSRLHNLTESLIKSSAGKIMLKSLHTWDVFALAPSNPHANHAASGTTAKNLQCSFMRSWTSSFLPNSRNAQVPAFLYIGSQLKEISP